MITPAPKETNAGQYALNSAQESVTGGMIQQGARHYYPASPQADHRQHT